MPRDLLKGLDGNRKSRQPELNCLECVQALWIDSMDALWDLANLHSSQRSYLFRPILKIMPNARTVHIHDLKTNTNPALDQAGIKLFFMYTCFYA
ncbi:hypothetical protein L202_05218 [Cryptococcus amylolentus CBS 6039]|uniref:Uncharacterized protein n=1 Tax=Cryptococcus amylolentus CBS 6039 TaxID=1295533 RepID=A0A1E3HLG4_9TREE|nr:hypothetical protein L202_05218 [Cryptococcus amylolentus CBS 6039]ODN76556.1 hypothetical protein L202_05218 [Cryptococcus amylolentus CBS 6039]